MITMKNNNNTEAENLDPTQDGGGSGSVPYSAYDLLALVEKVNPPLRTQADCKALVKGVKEGVIDAITSDHNPIDIENKKVEFIIPNKTLIEFKEALVFAFLGLLRVDNQVNCLKSVTGAKKDHSSGVIFNPKEF